MGRALPDGAQRRRIFVEMLASGISASQAAVHGRISWTTLYRWRRQDAAFRDAWDEAARAGAAATAAQRHDAMMHRALAPVAHPVVHRGEVVGVRQRHNDRALMFAMRDLRLRQQLRHEAAAAHASGPPRVTVLLQPLGNHGEGGGS